MGVWATYNSSTKRRGQYIAYTVTRAADGPDGMEARGRHSTGVGKGLKYICAMRFTGFALVTADSFELVTRADGRRLARRAPPAPLLMAYMYKIDAV